MSVQLYCYVLAPFTLLQKEQERLVAQRSSDNHYHLRDEKIEHDIDITQMFKKFTKLVATESIHSVKAIDASDVIFSSELHNVEKRINKKISNVDKKTSSTDKRVDELKDSLSGNDK